MIDFDALVNSVAQATFARPVTATPLPSQPVRSPFSATGIWSVRNTNLALGPGESLNTTDITLEIQLSTWAVKPVREMSVRVPAAGFYPDEGTLWIDDVDDDGQGWAVLTLKKQQPGPR